MSYLYSFLNESNVSFFFPYRSWRKGRSKYQLNLNKVWRKNEEAYEFYGLADFVTPLLLSEKKGGPHDQHMWVIGLHQKWPAQPSLFTRFQNKLNDSSAIPAYAGARPATKATFLFWSIERFSNQ